MSETRMMVCERCGGDGGWTIERTFDPFTGRIGYEDIKCYDCDGTGEVEVELQSPTLDDVLDLDYEMKNS